MVGYHIIFDCKFNAMLGGSSPISVSVPKNYIGSTAHKKYTDVYLAVTYRLAFLQNLITNQQADEFQMHEAGILHKQKNFITEHVQLGLPYKEFVHKNTPADKLIMLKLMLKHRK